MLYYIEVLGGDVGPLRRAILRREEPEGTRRLLSLSLSISLSLYLSLSLSLYIHIEHR